MTRARLWWRRVRHRVVSVLLWAWDGARVVARAAVRGGLAYVATVLAMGAALVPMVAAGWHAPRALAVLVLAGCWIEMTRHTVSLVRRHRERR